jgi:hypothetical protein
MRHWELAPPSPGSAVSVEAVLAPAPFGWVSLQLHYDGRNPPFVLLRDLASLGWSMPPPASRPASAIDWYTPDPETGQSFTVRPWRAVHDIDPPGRASTRARWEPEQRAGVLRALASVFLGHRVLVTSSVPELAALASGERPAPAAGPGSADADVDLRSVIVSFTAPGARGPGIEALLRTAGLVHRLTTDLRVRHDVFRGSQTETLVPVVTGEAIVLRSEAEALRVRLQQEQATAEIRAARSEDLERLDPVRQPPEAQAPAEPVSAPGVPSALVHVDLPMTGADTAQRIVAHPVLAGLDVTVAPGTRPVASLFRGSVSEVERPCLRVDVTCPPGMAPLVRAVLAQEARVSEDAVSVVQRGG